MLHQEFQVSYTNMKEQEFQTSNNNMIHQEFQASYNNMKGQEFQASNSNMLPSRFKRRKNTLYMLASLATIEKKCCFFLNGDFINVKVFLFAVVVASISSSKDAQSFIRLNAQDCIRERESPLDTRRLATNNAGHSFQRESKTK